MTDEYILLPQPQIVRYGSDFFTPASQKLALTNCGSLASRFIQVMGIGSVTVRELPCSAGETLFIHLGEAGTCPVEPPEQAEGYAIAVTRQYACIVARNERGLVNGLATWKQMVRQSGSGMPTVEIIDYPALANRGLMLDMSRGRVYTLAYLKDLVVLMASLKLNVLQLYIEHTFAFSFLDEVHAGADPITATEIMELDDWCREHQVELQPNLQSFGHCNRLLTTPAYRSLRESELYWTLSPADQGTYTLLKRMYDEYLPLFSSTVLNIDSDETYDLGSGRSASLMAELGDGRLYLQHLLRLRELASTHGKQLMVFGDVILHHPGLIAEVPDDIVFLDWIYDPLDEYKTPRVFEEAGKTFWVCPGTGSWNTLFPRQEGAVRNIMGLTLEGLQHGAQGMLLCDWGDHGNYGMPALSYYAYAVAAAVSWSGAVVDITRLPQAFGVVLGEPKLGVLHSLLEGIHRLPALWSKNRSQCVIALFDEPLMGRTLTAPLPPANLEPMRPLPTGVEGVLDAESHHLMRPIFQFPEQSLAGIERIVAQAYPLVDGIVDVAHRNQYRYTMDAYALMVEKVRLGRRIRTGFANCALDTPTLLDWEIELRCMIQRYTRLQIDFIDIWRSVAKLSEIDQSLTYFAHIIERLDYLKGFITTQRLMLQSKREPDYALATYQTAGYRSLPTY